MGWQSGHPFKQKMGYLFTRLVAGKKFEEVVRVAYRVRTSADETDNYQGAALGLMGLARQRPPEPN